MRTLHSLVGLILLILLVLHLLNAAPADPPRSWSVVDVGEWLSTLSLAEYRDAFEREAIDGEVLLELTANDFDTIGVTKLGHRKKLQRSIEAINKRETKTQQTPQAAHVDDSLPTSTPSPPEPPPPPTSSPDVSRISSDTGKGEKKKKKKKKDKTTAKSNASPSSVRSSSEWTLEDANRRVTLSEADRETIRTIHRDALAHHQSGRYDQARQLYKRILGIDSSHARSIHMLGLISMQADNDVQLAIQYLKKSIEISAESDSLINLGNFYWQLQKPTEAVKQWERALEMSNLAGGAALRARYADTVYNMAMTVYNEGKPDLCRQYMIQALRLAYEAEMIHYPADYITPTYIAGHDEMTRQQQELTHQIRLLQLDSWIHLGLLLQDNTNTQATALQCFLRAINITPDITDNQRPVNIQISTIRKEAENYAQALTTKGSATNKKSFNKDALSRAESEVNGFMVDRTDTTHKKLVEHLHKTCHFSTAFKLSQLILDDSIFESPKYKFFFNSNQEIMETREIFNKALTRIQTDLNLEALWPMPLGLEWCRFRFYLAYHGLNDRDINIKLSQTYLYLAPSLSYTALDVSKNNGLIAYKTGKIRVAFFSAFLTYHPVGRTLQGYIQYLPRDLFYIILFFVTLQPNVENDELKLKFEHNFSDKFIYLPVERIPNIRLLIEEEHPDILIYGDIGMEPTSYFISFSRLAPIQCLTFGHPDTSGVSTIDYFLSHKDMDDEVDGHKYYSEELVRLDGIGYWHRSPLSPQQTRSSVGLDDEQLDLKIPKWLSALPGGSWDGQYKWSMYLITKSIQFYSPDFLYAIGSILARNQRAIVVMIVDIGKVSRGFDMHNACQEMILDQIEANILRYYREHPDSVGAKHTKLYDDEGVVMENGTLHIPSRHHLSGRVRFIDKGDHDYFMALLQMTDVLLQPLPLDGTTTTLEAVSAATPTAIYRANMIGGRMAYAIYRHMQFEETIGTTVEEYIDIAVRLGTDRAFNKHVREEIRRRSVDYNVFEDKRAIDVMSNWIQKVVKEKTVEEKKKSTSFW